MACTEEPQCLYKGAQIDIRKYISINVKLSMMDNDHVALLFDILMCFKAPFHVLVEQSNDEMGKAGSVHGDHVKNVQKFSGKTTKLVSL